MADQHGGRNVQIVHDFRDIGAISLDRALISVTRAGAMAAQIDGDRLVIRRQIGYLLIPVGMRTSEAVYEHDWRLAVANDHMMDQRHYYTLFTSTILRLHRLPLPRKPRTCA